MSKQLEKIIEVRLVPSKNGIDLRVVTGSFRFVDGTGYVKSVSKGYAVKDLSSQAKTALLALWKQIKDAVETAEGTTPVRDPIIDTSAVISPL